MEMPKIQLIELKAVDKTKNSPLFLLIFVLEELFELLRVLHVGAAVCLWVKHTQPGPSADLYKHTHIHTSNQKNNLATCAVTKQAGV